MNSEDKEISKICEFITVNFVYLLNIDINLTLIDIWLFLNVRGRGSSCT